jgi:hypothetical protein
MILSFDIILAMKIHSHILCPACRQPMLPVELHCEACGISVSGRFANNEFAALNEEDLHFLRIFVLCEGRIRDMESALGVSYPTIKARMAQLKTTLAASRQAASGETPEPRESSVIAILKDLESGHVSYNDAMASLRKLQSMPKEPT